MIAAAETPVHRLPVEVSAGAAQAHVLVQ